MRKNLYPPYVRFLCFLRKLLIARRLRYWGGGGFIALSARVDNPQMMEVGHEVIVGEGVWLTVVEDKENTFDSVLCIGEGTTISRDAIISCAYRIQIGRESTLGPRVTVLDHNHGFDQPGRSVMAQPLTGCPVVIGDFVWLGANVIVLPGVNIGEGAVVGAGGIVTRDIPAYTLAVGNPARVIRHLNKPTDTRWTQAVVTPKTI